MTTSNEFPPPIPENNTGEHKPDQPNQSAYDGYDTNTESPQWTITIYRPDADKPATYVKIKRDGVLAYNVKTTADMPELSPLNLKPIIEWASRQEQVPTE